MKSPARGNVKSLSEKRATSLTVTDMPINDDDDELRKPYESHAPWDTDRESAEIRDIVPDDLVTVPCTECGKWIFEISHRCPYCKELQQFDDRDPKPIWLWIAATICALSMATLAVLTILLLLRWRG